MNYRMKMKGLTSVIIALVLPSLCSLAVGSLHHLRCEYLVNPVGIDASSPRLSWEICGKYEGGNLKADRGLRQGAYRILVASSAELLKQNQGDLWDTGKVV